MKLEDLDGVGPATAKKFKVAGIDSIMDLVVRGTVEVAALTGMTNESAVKMVSTAREFLAQEDLIMKDFTDGSEVKKRRENIGLINTGTNCFNSMLEGGLETQAITEIYGEFGCGKTQFCHTMCVQVQRPEAEGGLEGNVIYIDTENTFRPKRIEQMARARGMDEDKTLKNILVARAHDSSHQILILESCMKILKEKNIKLIVVDSLTGLFRSEYLGRGTLADRQQKLNHFMKMLNGVAEKYDIAVIATNQVTASPDVMFGDPAKAIGGNIVAHSTTYRMYFRKFGKKRVAKMMDSPQHADEEVLFGVDESGITDYVDKKK